MALYEVSCSIQFKTKADRDAAYNYLDSKAVLAKPLGDSLESEGDTGLSFSLRLPKNTDRTTLKNYLSTLKTKIAADTSGYIEAHLCRHDEGRACEKDTQVIETWGSASV